MVMGSNTTKIELELRRGALVLATLSQLGSARYGYQLRQRLAEQGLTIEEGTLYPLLRRLETQGLLNSDWRTGEGAPRRYYVLNASGRRLLKKLRVSWRVLNRTMELLLTDGGEC